MILNSRYEQKRFSAIWIAALLYKDSTDEFYRDKNETDRLLSKVYRFRQYAHDQR